MGNVLNPPENQIESDGGALAATAAATAAAPVVQAWDIRQAGQIGNEQLRAINQLHENFARNLTVAIGGYLRIAFDCRLASAEQLTYREFLQRVPEQTYLASCDLLPVGATALFQLDFAIAFPIIEVLLGGEGASGGITRDITEIEGQVLEGLVRIICRELQASWHALSLEFKFGARQHLVDTPRLMSPEEKNLCLNFEIKMSETRGALNLAVPAVVSNALLRKISADFSYQRPRGPIEARQQLQKKLLNCFFPLELCLPRLQVPLQNLTDLAPGDLISFSRNASAAAVMLIEGVPIGSATPVRVNARRAARVLSLEATLAAVDES
jgi:flagellar motor switch protein FliM